MLFSYLTVGEHLELFATLKGVSKLHIPRVVQDMAASLGLRKEMKSPASSLSGGQQRKLQVCTRESVPGDYIQSGPSLQLHLLIALTHSLSDMLGSFNQKF